jgi:hypothetical protein
MADRLKAEIVAGRFSVGPNPNPANEFTLSITNSGSAIKWDAEDPPHLYLTGDLDAGENALFLNESDVWRCVPKCSEAGWHLDWDLTKKADKKFSLDIYTFNPTIFGTPNKPLTITFTKVVSRTAPGDAHLTFEVAIPGIEQEPQKRSISKIADKPDIINFTSNPPEGVQNFPNESVTLEWCVYDLSSVELTRVGSTDPLPIETSEDQGGKLVEGKAIIKDLSVDTEFRLRGYAGSRLIDRTLGVKVLRNDWYDLRKTISPGDGGYPPPRSEAEAEALAKAVKAGQPPRFELEPTLVFNANDDSLYAIFRHTLDGKKRALLFQTENPFGGWNFVESSVEGQDGVFVPEGFATSPGIYFGGELWLIGGSQVEPKNTSNEVWCFNPKEKIWRKKTWKAEVWPRRMGHGVVWSSNRIWVIGGCDHTGSALRDVWSLDTRNAGNEWKKAGVAPWEPRCLISPTVYDDRIWVYGGTRQPTSSELFGDLYAFSPNESGGGDWEEIEIRIIQGSEGKKPIASCLQVFQEKLHLLGKFQTVASDESKVVESQAFSLVSLGTKTWSRFPSDRLQNWWGERTSSYQLVNFKAGSGKDKMLIARALSDKPPNTVLKVYVP